MKRILGTALLVLISSSALATPLCGVYEARFEVEHPSHQVFANTSIPLLMVTPASAPSKPVEPQVFNVVEGQMIGNVVFYDTQMSASVVHNAQTYTHDVAIKVIVRSIPYNDAEDMSDYLFGITFSDDDLESNFVNAPDFTETSFSFTHPIERGDSLTLTQTSEYGHVGTLTLRCQDVKKEIPTRSI